MIDLSFHPATIYELRTIEGGGAGKKAVQGAYFTDRDKLARFAARMDGKRNMYVTMNQPRESVLARHEQGKMLSGELTKDSDIDRRLMVLVDADPVRDTGISSTEDERAYAYSTIIRVRDFCTGYQFPDPMLMSSGNGYHALYRVDLANTDDTKNLVQRFLKALSWKFSDGKVSIDTSVFNAARITRAYGSRTVKGVSTEERPHRLSGPVEIPAIWTPVPEDRLRAVADLAPEEHRDHDWAASPTGRTLAMDRLDIGAWLSGHGLHVVQSGSWQGGTKWIVNPCPWNSDHDDNSMCVVQLPTGALAAKCWHNGCQGQDWFSLRDLLEPGWRERRRSSASSNVVPLFPQPTEQPQEVKPKTVQWLDDLFLADMPDACFPPLIKAYVELFRPCTEAAFEYHAAGFVVAMGAVLGRSVWFNQGIPIFPNVYACLIGDSGRSRKSTAASFALSMVQRIDAGLTVCEGLGSAEILIDMLAEADELPPPEKPAYRRLLLYFDELANVIRKGQRENSVLLQTIVEAYDCKERMANQTRAKRVVAENPTLSILACSTPTWVKQFTTMSEVLGGFMNRFLFIDGEPGDPIPTPPVPSEMYMRKASEKFWEHAYEYVSSPRSIEMDLDAKKRWTEFYDQRATLKPSSEMVANLFQRAHTNAIKVAMIYAVSQGKTVIELPDIEAGIGVALYSSRVVTTMLADIGGSQKRRLEEAIERHLRKGRPMTARELRQVTGASADEVQKVLTGMLTAFIIQPFKDGRRVVYAWVEEQT